MIIYPDDTYESLRLKALAATLLGCLQATLIDFNFLSRTWKKNCSEERLIGVSLTGLRDHPVLSSVNEQARSILRQLRIDVRAAADLFAEFLGIARPAATTCCKPSGTVSALVGSSSGLHPRYAAHYIRRVRVSASDPLAKMLIAQGVPHSPEVGQSASSGVSTWVFEFPQKAPNNAVLRDDVDAIEQLEYYLMLKKEWCDMNPSITVQVKEDEWFRAGAWVYDHWDWIGGITVLPYSGGVYQLAPYEEISEASYQEKQAAFPTINMAELPRFEQEDCTEGAQTIACTGGQCEL